MTRIHAKKRAIGVAAALALALVPVACGDDDDEETTAADTGTAAETTEAGAGQEITVTADEYSFELSEEPQAGEATFTLDNVGEEEHEMVFVRIADDATFDEALEAEGEEGTVEGEPQFIAPVKPGETSPDGLTTELTPGTYGMVCLVKDDEGTEHVQLGQHEEIEITE